MSVAFPTKWGDLAVRTGSAIVLIPLVVFCVWEGGIAFLLFVALLGILIAHEWTMIVFPQNLFQYSLHIGAAICGVLLTYFLDAWTGLASVLIIALISGLSVRFGDGAKSYWSYAGVFYVGLPCISFTLLRANESYGAAAILWIFLIVWGADILAYFAGRTIGGPKLAPRISPKKTWAGLGGAVAGSAIMSIVFAKYMGLNGILALAGLAAIFAVVEQAGDLFESSLKRYFGVKDSGRLIPGHGGVIDRVDGLIAVVIAAAAIGFFHAQGRSPAEGLLLW